MIWAFAYIVIGFVVLLACAAMDDGAPPVAGILMVLVLWPIIAVVGGILIAFAIEESVREHCRNRLAQRQMDRE